MRIVGTASLLALASLSAIAHAEGSTNDSEDGIDRAELCGAIACRDGSQECGRISGKIRTLLWIPFFPSGFLVPVHVDTPVNFTCYEPAMK